MIHFAVVLYAVAEGARVVEMGLDHATRYFFLDVFRRQR